MADLLPISERLYDLSILLVFRFDDTYEHDVLLNHHIPVEEVRSHFHKTIDPATTNDKFKFIKAHASSGWSVAKMCEVLEVSRSGYYDWLGRPPSRRAKRHARILSRIRKVHQKHPTYGLDPIWAEVRESIPCSRGTVYRLMKKHNIRSKRKIKWKATTNSKHNLPVAPNLLNQRFDAPLPNTVWVSDITYHWTEEGWLYTAIVKDLCTKEVVGHASSKRMTKELVIKALKMALERARPADGLIFHSDR